ncbi:acyl dehydratase [Rhodococcus hoagii]|nr:acyl dehydratase [Prescottella equi]
MTRPAESTEERAARRRAPGRLQLPHADFYEVGREKVREYATAVQNAHPAHYDEQAARDLGTAPLVAPLTFVSVIGIIAQKYLFEQIVPGSTSARFCRRTRNWCSIAAIRAGDRLTVDVSLASFRQTAGSDIIVTKNEVCDDAGVPVVTTLTTLVGRTGDTSDPLRIQRIKDVMMREA